MLVWELEAKSLSFWTMILASWSFNGGSCHTRCKRKTAFGEVCIAWISQLRKTRVFSHLHLWLFPLLCLALYPLLLHFQGNHCSKSHYFGHITALHSTSPCASSCRVVCCQHLQASQLLRSLEKGERRWPYTVSSKLYIYLNLSEGQNAGHRECRICHQV